MSDNDFVFTKEHFWQVKVPESIRRVVDERIEYLDGFLFHISDYKVMEFDADDEVTFLKGKGWGWVKPGHDAIRMGFSSEYEARTSYTDTN